MDRFINLLLMGHSRHLEFKSMPILPILNRSKFRLVLFFIMVLSIPFGSKAQGGIDHWETVVFNDDTWSYRVGTSAPPANWMQPLFDDSAWPTGPGGFGYGDGDDNTTILTTISLCIRIPFDLADTSKIDMALLHADYDDAFVAFLNGTEIARGNFGALGTSLGYNDIPPTDHEATLYQGGIPEAYPIYSQSFDQLFKEGENILAIQINNFLITSSDFSSNFFLSLAINDTSRNFEPIPSWFFLPFLGTQLPLIKINTSNQAIVDDPRINANMKVVDNGPGVINYVDDPGTDYDGWIAIEIRGNSSQMYEKKNYGLETQDQNGNNNNVSLLGMPDENDWILHGPYSDKSLIRNALSFQIGRDMMDYASQIRFCELMINNDYRGIYVLMEKIKRDDNRVDIANLRATDISGDELTGGYIFKIDRDDTTISNDGWYSPHGNNPFYAYHNPDYDKLVSVQKDYIRNWMTDFELAMTQPDFDSTFEDYIDVASFIDYFLINELAKHIDAFKLSFYMYKKKNSNGGKLHMGPIWDFNLGYGNFDFGCDPEPQDWIYPCTSRAFWLNKIMDIPSVQDRMYCRWVELRQQELSTTFLMNSIDTMVVELGPAVNRNFDRFDILGTYVWPNYFIGNTHGEEINFLKNWLGQRLNWMDGNMFGDPNTDCSALLSIAKEELNNHLNIYPNPFENQIRFTINDGGMSDGEVFILDLQGRIITRLKPSRQPFLDLSNLSPGMYFYVYRNEQQILQTGKLVKQ